MPARVPLLTLIVHVPGAEDRRIEIFDWRTVIGRSSKNDVQIVAKQISKIHAAIEIEDNVPYIRDLGSRNGVDVNGHPVIRSQALQAGDMISLGEANLTVDPHSLVFQPTEAQEVLKSLLTEEAALRRRTRSEYRELVERRELTVNESMETTRQAAVLIGRWIGTATGAAPVLRRLRIAEEFGPRDTARIEPFVLELENGYRVWIRPFGDVDVTDIAAFPVANDVWFDEPEDFQSRPRAAQILMRTMHYLPPLLKVVGASDHGAAPDGLSVFSEAFGSQPLVLSPV